MVFAKTLNKTKFSFIQSFCKNHQIFRLQNFYWMIERSKPHSNVLLIFCDSMYFIFNKLETMSIARSVMVGLCYPGKILLRNHRISYACIRLSATSCSTVKFEHNIKSALNSSFVNLHDSTF